MKRPRLLQWPVDTPPVAHPYRDTLLVYGGLALVVLVFGWATGGGFVHPLVVAVLFFVVASSWGLLRWRRILRQRAEAAARAGVEE